MKPKHQRLLYILLGLCSLAIAVTLILRNMREHMVFFYTPSELIAAHPAETTRVRVGGLVKAGSLESPEGGDSMEFVLTDMEKEIVVDYNGIRPNLFREGQGMVATGFLKPDGSFRADELLAKHDENYMPKEVADKLKASGHWEGK
jgi:cytochrome c-type biogenesis protein CcmE